MISRRKSGSMAVAMLLFVLLAAGCSGVKRVEKGKACWYGPGYEGKRTASGEVLNSSAFTAAHRTLPFNTIVRVTNLNNGREVRVRINDRGPFKGAREARGAAAWPAAVRFARGASDGATLVQVLLSGLTQLDSDARIVGRVAGSPPCIH
jgi:rare lipoprotein A